MRARRLPNRSSLFAKSTLASRSIAAAGLPVRLEALRLQVYDGQPDSMSARADSNTRSWLGAGQRLLNRFVPGDCGGELDFKPRLLPAELRAGFFGGRDLVAVPARDPRLAGVRQPGG